MNYARDSVRRGQGGGDKDAEMTFDFVSGRGAAKSGAHLSRPLAAVVKGRMRCL